jgi:hypothetical protein
MDHSAAAASATAGLYEPAAPLPRPARSAALSMSMHQAILDANGQ